VGFAVLSVPAANPSHLAVHPTFNFLYAANEVGTFSGKETGSVSAFAIDRATGKLAALNQESSVGRSPVYPVGARRPSR
jgi:6-phosphogluconolactonase